MGFLSLWMAANFPGARITSVSNSHSQGEYIISEAKSRNLPNLEVVTADVNVFSTKENFERVVSVEMFEHVPATTAGFFGAFTIGWNRVANSSLTRLLSPFDLLSLRGRGRGRLDVTTLFQWGHYARRRTFSEDLRKARIGKTVAMVWRTLCEDCRSLVTEHRPQPN